jgi:hypothetical protein
MLISKLWWAGVCTTFLFRQGLVLGFREERRQGRRRGKLKARSTGLMQLGPFQPIGKKQTGDD